MGYIKNKELQLNMTDMKLSTHNKLIIYKLILTSIYMYDIELCHIKHIQIFQNKVMRNIIHDIPQYAHNSDNFMITKSIMLISQVVILQPNKKKTSSVHYHRCNPSCGQRETSKKAGENKTQLLQNPVFESQGNMKMECCNYV